jgi:peptide chain release factor 2
VADAPEALSADDLAAAVADLKARLVWVRDYLDPSQLQERLEELDGQIGAPGFWDDQERAVKVSAERTRAARKLELYERLSTDVEDAGDLVVMLADAPELADEVSAQVVNLGSRIDELEEGALFSGEYDAGPAVVTISAGAGGTDSMDWAEMLLRMYLRWAERRSFKTELLEASPGEEAGLKSVSLLVDGENAYGIMGAEKGVHRLVRLSPFDSAHRRHTAFARVDVTPWVDEDVDVEIDESDLRIDTYRASGAGGQHVNKTDSAVRITHMPTGIVVQCQNERSQTSNKQTAMRVLKSRLIELELKKREEELAKARGTSQDNSFGSQIRSYVLHPYTMVNDHRTNRKDGNVQAVLDGDIDPFIRDFLLRRTAADGDVVAES